jgi:hypothetical protein
MKRALALTVVMMSLAACQPTVSKQEKAEIAKPVDCSTAQADLATLQSEKTSTAKRMAEGVSAVFPIGLVVNSASGNEGDAMKVATGDYNKMLDNKIAEIKSQCGIK